MTALDCYWADHPELESLVQSACERVASKLPQTPPKIGRSTWSVTSPRRAASHWPVTKIIRKALWPTQPGNTTRKPLTMSRPGELITACPFFPTNRKQGDNMTTTIYRAEFFTAADYAVRSFEAETP